MSKMMNHDWCRLDSGSMMYRRNLWDATVGCCVGLLITICISQMSSSQQCRQRRCHQKWLIVVVVGHIPFLLLSTHWLFSWELWQCRHRHPNVENYAYAKCRELWQCRHRHCSEKVDTSLIISDRSHRRHRQWPRCADITLLQCLD